MYPTEHNSVQSRILEYAQDIGWIYVPRNEADRRRHFDQDGISPQDKAKNASLFFDDILFENVREFNPQYSGSIADLLRKFEFLDPDIFGNRDFWQYLKGEKTFYYEKEKRELNLILIDYIQPERNIYEVTEEFYYFNGRNAAREDVVFLINGIPVLVIECKNATIDEALAIGMDQIRRYHLEIPELFIPQQIFTVTESIGFLYGVTWNTIKRNLFNWKEEKTGNLEAKIKSFCAHRNILDFLKDYIVFAEKEQELNKYILRQHQKSAVEKVIRRSHDPRKTRGLIWHTQGSGKTYTMIKAAEILFKAPESDKPTILLMIDRNELEDQLIKNLDSVRITNIERAASINSLRKLLKENYRGIIVTTIHKFYDMPAKISMRDNIYVLIDEAHRTTGGDLGNYLMAAVPNATYIGFTGTPVDKTAYGKGTFKTFGIDDELDYLDKYSIADSIEDGTTLPLFYDVAPNELKVPKEILEEEFLNLVETEGISDIDELNKILERAVNTRNFLKGKKRVEKIARYVATHYRDNVEPLGYKAFLVGVDREACALYKKALDRYLPEDYSAVVYTGAHNDPPRLKEFHLDSKKEREIRKAFIKLDQKPRILIVTEKLLTGFDAPVLYAMYLDKPMRDHTLLQAIARVNRPYENEEHNMVKPHGFILDFVGIFDKLEKALAFDSDEVNAIVKDIKLLKILFKENMEKKAPDYLNLIRHNFNDKDTDYLIEHFRDQSRRKELFKLFKEVEMLYEIISPDAFVRPYIDDYTTLSSIYKVVRNAYSKKIYADREFQKKTNELVKKHIGSTAIEQVNEFFEIDDKSIEKIKEEHAGKNVKIINLVKSIQKSAEENRDDPFLIGLKERAEQVELLYQGRQITTQEALDRMKDLIEQDIERKKKQAEKGLDGLNFFIYSRLSDHEFREPEKISRNIRGEFIKHSNWRTSEKELRELRQALYFAILSENDDIDKAHTFVDELFNMLFKAYEN